jgi:abortive infection bacteriophage resistance protein
MAHYSKPPLTVEDQIARLKARGLHIPDDAYATRVLSNISFYRLRAYTYPFQDNDDPNHPFLQDISFEEIIQLYTFDRQLRLTVFDALEKIEISLRTKIIYHYSLAFGSHWQEDRSLFRNGPNFDRDRLKLKDEVTRSPEPFIKHYKSKYQSPANPPSWMGLEVASMGLLSKVFSNLKKGPVKNTIAAAYQLPNVAILESWLHAISALRNICAHHGRLWNRRLTLTPQLPNNTLTPFLLDRKFNPQKIYLLKTIDQGDGFPKQIKALLANGSLVELKDMGFTTNWETEPVWA